MEFSIKHNDANTNARTGLLSLPHGKLETPVFMPVGTNATVKAITPHSIEDIGYRIILSNSYHLFLRPGTGVIKEAGGLHQFMSWPHNILTDSGGYQVFSLAPFRKIKVDGIYFRSHIDGSYHTLSPKGVVDIQSILRSDIMMPLDVCTGPDSTYKQSLEALETTTRWAKQSKAQWLLRTQDKDYNGNLFGIVQGNFFQDLRKRSAEEITSLELPGYAIGGLSVGEDYSQFVDFLAYTSEFLPVNKPRYIMGIGTPEYILHAVENGIDMFDCVFATRTARNGLVFTQNGSIALKKAYNEYILQPIEPGCSCYACTHYSRAYLRHLFKSKEILGPMLATYHNLEFLFNFLVDIRNSIAENRFTEFKESFLSKYGGE